ncbi:MAG: FAD-dependent oxidoreductase [Acidobacteriota bacterium]
MSDVTIYTMEGCPFCINATSFLEEKNIPYTEIQARLGSREWTEMKSRTGSGSLPQILVKDRSIGGYSDLVNLEATGQLYEMLGVEAKSPFVTLYDVIVLGGGPAGLSAALYSIRKLLKTLIISKDMGGQITWTSDVDNYLGFSQVNALELVAKFEDHVRRFDIEKVIGAEVNSVNLTGRIKQVVTTDGKVYYGKTIIIATGGRHRPLNIPGEMELVGKGLTYCSTCDAPLYTGVDVAVVGGGNSGLEATLDLIGVANKVYLVSNTRLTGDPVYQGKIRQSQKVEILTDHAPVRVIGDQTVTGLEIQNTKTNETRTLPVEGVFVEIGILPNSSLFLDTLAANHRGEILIDAECRTGVTGVFACGDVTNVPFKQVVVAVGEGSKAALSAYSYLINQK